MKFSVDERIKEIPPYPKAYAYGSQEGLIFLSANENPYPPSPKVITAIMESLFFLNRYPEGEGDLKEAIAKNLGLKPENIIVSCGSNEIIEVVLRVSKMEGKNKVLIPSPSFAFYSIASKIYGYEVTTIPLKGFHIDVGSIKEGIDERTRIVFLCNPNNPTGTIVEKRDFEALIEGLPPDVLLVVDEAYYEFVESSEFPVSFDYIGKAPIVTLRTFSKAYGLAGLRVGYGISDADFIDLLEKARQPFSTNSLALIAAKAALEDKSYKDEIVTKILRQKKFLCEKLEEIGIEVVRSESNFILLRIGKSAEDVTRKLFNEGIVVRWMGPLGLPEYVRVTVGRREENEIFLNTMRRIISEG